MKVDQLHFVGVPSKQYKVVAPNGKTTVVFAGRRTLFTSYDEARQAVRKLIRRKVRKGIIERYSTLTGLFDDISRNPTRLAGYKIVAI